MKIIKRLFVFILITLLLIPFFPQQALASIPNPNDIQFGSGTTQNYNVFYNVLETGDWLITAEGYVYYNLATSIQLNPNGAGIETNLTPSAGANWQCVSDGSDLTYVSTASTTYVRDFYTIQTSTVTSGTIQSVGVYFRIENDGAGTTYGVPRLYINGNIYPSTGSAQTAIGAWSTKNQTFTYNPATGLAWDWGTVNTMQVGIELAATANNALCSEVYVVVSYLAVDPGATADQAFLFELLNVAGTSTLAATTLQAYGDRPISIYLTASQVTTLGLVVGTSYKLRIRGNPVITFSGGGATNTVTVSLGSNNYIDQTLGTDSDPPTDNQLRNQMINYAQQIQIHDQSFGVITSSSTDAYIITITGYKYLTINGGDIFVQGIPNLQNMCPVLFQAGLTNMSSAMPTSQGNYALTLTPAQQWGNTVADGLTNLGVYLGINQALAGSVVLFVLAIMLAVFVYTKTESGISVLLLVAATPFLGAYLGLMPLALAFIFVIFIVVLLGYFFFSRGAL